METKRERTENLEIMLLHIEKDYEISVSRCM